MKTKILSWLLHHANREGKDDDFYRIKKRILEKHGLEKRFDVQHIEGKRCWTCNGTGVFICDWKEREVCLHCCGTGMYKDPQWNILKVIDFGKYSFHIPCERWKFRPPIDWIPGVPWYPIDWIPGYPHYFNGYINHKRSNFGEYAKIILFILYDWSSLKRWYRMAGLGWRVFWWKPINWPQNLVHLIKRKHKSIPFIRLKGRVKDKLKPKKKEIPNVYDIPDEELPF